MAPVRPRAQEAWVEAPAIKRAIDEGERRHCGGVGDGGYMVSSGRRNVTEQVAEKGRGAVPSWKAEGRDQQRAEGERDDEEGGEAGVPGDRGEARRPRLPAAPPPARLRGRRWSTTGSENPAKTKAMATLAGIAWLKGAMSISAVRRSTRKTPMACRPAPARCSPPAPGGIAASSNGAISRSWIIAAPRVADRGVVVKAPHMRRASSSRSGFSVSAVGPVATHLRASSSAQSRAAPDRGHCSTAITAAAPPLQRLRDGGRDRRWWNRWRRTVVQQDQPRILQSTSTRAKSARCPPKACRPDRFSKPARPTVRSPARPAPCRPGRWRKSPALRTAPSATRSSIAHRGKVVDLGELRQIGDVAPGEAGLADAARQRPDPPAMPLSSVDCARPGWGRSHGGQRKPDAKPPLRWCTAGGGDSERQIVEVEAGFMAMAPDPAQRPGDRVSHSIAAGADHGETLPRPRAQRESLSAARGCDGGARGRARRPASLHYNVHAWQRGAAPRRIWIGAPPAALEDPRANEIGDARHARPQAQEARPPTPKRRCPDAPTEMRVAPAHTVLAARWGPRPRGCKRRCSASAASGGGAQVLAAAGRLF